MKEYIVISHDDCIAYGFKTADEAFDYIKDRDDHGYDTRCWSVKCVHYTIKNISYISSKAIRNSKQLKEVFRDKCGIEIDGRIYTSIESILDIGYIIEGFYYMEEGLDFRKMKIFDVESSEFNRIHAMAYTIHFPN